MRADARLRQLRCPWSTPMARKRREGQPIRRRAADDLWRRVSEPGPGAVARGYLRFSNQAGHYGLTLEGQRQHLRAYCEARGWTLDGFDEEPAQSAKYEEIEKRPIFQRHLAAAQRGDFAVSLCYMADRWARNKITAFVSLSQLRRAGVWWATTDGKWTIDRTEEDGWDVAFSVEVTLNAAYSRRVSEKTRIGKQTRASLGFPNGDIMFGYQRAPEPPRPVGAPLAWRPPRQPLEPHSVNFERLQQMGAWAAAGLSDSAIAARATEQGWRTQTQKAGHAPRPFGKDSVRSLLLNPFPREFAPGASVGTIWTPAGERIAGRHVAAFAWDVWQRMDERRALRHYGSRGQQREHQRSQQPFVWVFSGYVVCVACGSRLRADGTNRHGYHYYRDTARKRGYDCPATSTVFDARNLRQRTRGPLSVRADRLEAQFLALLATPFVEDWRAYITEGVACGAEDGQTTPDWQAIDVRRANLTRELERLKFQHQHGLIGDDDLVREATRIQQALGALPSSEAQAALAAESLALGEALVAQGSVADYWQIATSEERVELVTALLLPDGVRYDLATQRIVGLAPRLVAAPVLRILLTGAGWRTTADGWLMAPDAPDATSGETSGETSFGGAFPLSG